jgi:hypothetical protein
VIVTSSLFPFFKRITTEFLRRLNSYNAVLLLVALLVAALAWHTARERARLTARRDELAQMVGDVAIADRTKLHVQAVEAGEKLHFVWRLYVPPNFPLVLPMPGGGSVSIPSPRARDFIARIRFQAHPMQESHSGSSQPQFRGPALNLRNRRSNPFLPQREFAI